MEDGLAEMWLTFSLLVLAAAIAAAVWSMLAGQFRNQDRARSLPLWAAIEEDETPGESGSGPEKPDSD